MEIAYKKTPIYIVDKNITIKEFRNKYAKVYYKPIWKVKDSDLGYALSSSLNRKKIWWVTADYFNKNYEIKE